MASHFCQRPNHANCRCSLLVHTGHTDWPRMSSTLNICKTGSILLKVSSWIKVYMLILFMKEPILCSSCFDLR